MKIATDAILNMNKQIDLILEVVDARGIHISSNTDLLKLLPNKPIVKLALKSDLSDLNLVNKSNLIFASKFQKNLRSILLNSFKHLMHEKTLKFKNKGLLLPNYNIVVIGLPNVGKSTIINILANKIKAKTENRPGVTKSVSTIKLNEMFNLIDTPGILFKKIDDFEVGAKLTLMGIIKSNVVPLDDILFFAYNYLKTNYVSLLKDYILNFDLDDQYEDFLIKLATKRNFISIKNKLDLQKTAETFFNNLTNGNIGKLNYEH
ncbi:ribosome biogenesis GTPase YlqF [Mycoplasmoides pirum]|nr:ribosome biogenesis GTPase YlqF [Mycoplasmoides pirum]